MAEEEFLLPSNNDTEYDRVASCASGQAHYGAIATHVFALSAVVLVWIWVVGTGSGLSWKEANANVFNWHPLLMTAAIICASESAVLFKSPLFSRATKKRGHALLHACAAVFMLCGLIAVFRFHNEHSPPIRNLYSLHSWLGLTTVLVFSTQGFGGALVFFTGLFTESRKRRFLPLHSGIGMVIIVVLMGVTALTGINERLIFIKVCNPVLTAQCITAHALGFVLLFLCSIVFATLR